ncbi:hypothetical protein BJ684DRAFT_19318 [Piptocephalis cylindrospora]|uniref:Uncharacterized protein n=1 Tax=Piptocephalis cylindrospora TaxID=1907219 RepID=A0A4P9Y5N2_9FUNG|nr:hypothetical protein BJ684DRAFT_19318 [Piptocephalis cylindrospora]|eukprot:RKP14265.1 hypothetical protein BJ684DRAFT_19318 [Piptocephalis cylindrospora]
MTVDRPPFSLTISSFDSPSPSVKPPESSTSLGLPVATPLSPFFLSSSDLKTKYSAPKRQLLSFPTKPPGPANRRPPHFPPNPIPNSIWRLAPGTPPNSSRSRAAPASKKAETPMTKPRSNTQVTNITYISSAKPKVDPYPFPPLTRSPTTPEEVADLRTFIHKLLGKNQPPPSTRHVQLPGEEKGRKSSNTTTQLNFPRKESMGPGVRKGSLAAVPGHQGPPPLAPSSDATSKRPMERQRTVSMSATSKDLKVHANSKSPSPHPRS